MGELKSNREARYIHGVKGKGMFTFYGGHDPEDYQHRVGDPKTELDLFPNSSMSLIKDARHEVFSEINKELSYQEVKHFIESIKK